MVPAAEAWSTWPCVSRTLVILMPCWSIAACSRSKSPPGSTAVPSMVSSHQAIEQFCWNGVTGAIMTLSMPPDLMPPVDAGKGVCWRPSCVLGNETAVLVLHPGPGRPVGIPHPGADRAGRFAFRSGAGGSLCRDRRRHRRDAARTQCRALRVSRIARQAHDDLHRLRGAQGRAARPRHAHGVLRLRRSMPPSKLGVGAGQTITVEQGLQSLVARSANDAATAFGEMISGSTPAFAQRMTETAARLGMNASQFRNANGLPDAGQITTARDMAILAMALVKEFPQYYGYFHTQEFMLGKTRVGPGIKFLELYAPYADGLKTGFICASGFNIVGSAVRDGRRLIAVAFGFRRADLRDEFLIRLLDEAYVLKTGSNRPRIWQLRNGAGGPGTVFAQGECGIIRYDMPGDAAWLGTYPDWKSARHVYDVGQADLARLGFSRLGKEYILPVTANKVTRQAAIIADLEPAAAQRLCADYQQRKLFCLVKRPEDFVSPFGAFWR